MAGQGFEGGVEVPPDEAGRETLHLLLLRPGGEVGFALRKAGGGDLISSPPQAVEVRPPHDNKQPGLHLGSRGETLPAVDRPPEGVVDDVLGLVAALGEPAGEVVRGVEVALHFPEEGRPADFGHVSGPGASGGG